MEKYNFSILKFIICGFKMEIINKDHLPNFLWHYFAFSLLCAFHFWFLIDYLFMYAKIIKTF